MVVEGYNKGEKKLKSCMKLDCRLLKSHSLEIWLQNLVYESLVSRIKIQEQFQYRTAYYKCPRWYIAVFFNLARSLLILSAILRVYFLMVSVVRHISHSLTLHCTAPHYCNHNAAFTLHQTTRLIWNASKVHSCLFFKMVKQFFFLWLLGHPKKWIEKTAYIFLKVI